MRPICIKDTEESPAIFLDLDSARLIITGISVMADPQITYSRLIRVIRKHNFPSNVKSNVSILLQETNTQSLLFLLEVLRLLKNTNPQNNIHIDWLYDSTDLDLKEKIEIFSEILECNINGVPYVKIDWEHGGSAKKAFKTVKIHY